MKRTSPHIVNFYKMFALTHNLEIGTESSVGESDSHLTIYNIKYTFFTLFLKTYLNTNDGFYFNVHLERVPLPKLALSLKGPHFQVSKYAYSLNYILDY